MKRKPALGQDRLRAGTRVLVVEDEVLVAMYIEDVLKEDGCHVVGVATRVGEALGCIGSHAIDVAVLDLNLNGDATYAVADELKRRGIPFIFSTGYDAAGIREDYRGQPAIEKPFGENDLRRAIGDALK